MSDSPAESPGPYGYPGQFRRTVRSFGSFAIAFSTASALTGIVTTYGFLLNTSGPRGLWMWIASTLGRLAVAAVIAQMVARIPLTGFLYQWTTRLTNTVAGWGMGWLYFSTLPVIILATDLSLVTLVFFPLFDITPSTAEVTLAVVVVIALQALLAIWSTRIVNWVNSAAVGAELVALAAFVVILFIASVFTGHAHWGNFASLGVVPAAGYWGITGPFAMGALLGAYTIAGFEGAAELSEETQAPTRTAPRAIIRAVIVSGASGFLFLVGLTAAMKNVSAASAAASPVATILDGYIGSSFERVILILVLIAMFSCALCLMLSASRTIFAMARDQRFPAHRLLASVPEKTGTPAWATAFTGLACVIVELTAGQSANAFNNILSGGTVISVVLYLAAGVLYLVVRRKLPAAEAGAFNLRKWDIPVAVAAVIWTSFEVIVLTVPAGFHTGDELALIFLATGVVLLAAYLVLKPRVFRAAPAVEAEAPVPAAD